MFFNTSHIVKGASFFLIAGMTLTACVDEYWPEIGSAYENILVVDGIITNEPGPYDIKLSTATNINNPHFVPALNCEVIIADSDGNQEYLDEIGEGVYRTSANAFRGEIGKSYKLSVQLPNEKFYESDFEYLQIPTGIDSIYMVFENYPHPELERPIVGYRFHINTHKSEVDTNYYLWRMESAFEYNSIHYIKFIYDGNFHPFYNYDSLYTCWKSKNIPEIFTYSTADLTEPIISGFPLHYVSTDTRELSIRYSLFVNQLSITEQAFVFWDKLKEFDIEAGALFSKQPYQVRGNMWNVEDKEEPVLGYFMVAGSSQKRIFVDKPKDIDFHYPDECNIITEDIITMLWIMYDQWPVYLTGVYNDFGYGPGLPLLQKCVDCTEHGGSLTPPDFWEE